MVSAGPWLSERCIGAGRRLDTYEVSGARASGPAHWFAELGQSGMVAIRLEQEVVRMVAEGKTIPDGQFDVASEVDGLTIHTHHWSATGDVKGIIVIAHGAAEHGARYARFAAALAQAGFETLAPDHRGHGRSPGPGGLGDLGKGGWDGLVADLAQLTRMARAAHPGRPVVLFGHSMGSFAAQQCCAENGDLFDALVLSGSAGLDFPEELQELPVFDFNLGFQPSRTPYDWLSRDPVEVDKYVADPLCGFDAVAPAYDLPILRKVFSAETMGKLKPGLPVLLLAGDKDPLNVGLLLTQRLEEKLHEAGVKQVDRLVYADGRHEMLNEINRGEVMQDVIAWFSKVLPG